ncbi:MAG: hypothetical protein KAG64_03855 [Bacteroidales bacterium]|nr:hypothetical protein [Bacteroidales bacterium]
MHIDNFYKCFEDSVALSKLSITDLEKLTKDAPYFQAAWMLMAKAKNTGGSSDYHEVLGKAAARVFNREQLFDFIYAQEQIEKPVVVTKEEKLTKPKTEKPKSIAKKKSVEKSHSVGQSKISSIEKPQAPKIMVKDDGETIKSKEDLRALVKERLQAIDKEKAVVKENRKIKPKVKAASEKDKSNVDIIDTFIKHNPTINKPQDIDYKEEIEVAKKSLDEKFDFVSETLAEINLKQGHTKKAIKIYEKLSLKYPEKSSYFAAQIKKVKLSK